MSLPSSDHYKRIHSSATKALFGYLDEAHRCPAGSSAFSTRDETFRYAARGVEVQVSLCRVCEFTVNNLAWKDIPLIYMVYSLSPPRIPTPLSIHSSKSSFEVPVVIHYPNSTITYDFHTAGEDIQFAVLFAIYPSLTHEEEAHLLAEGREATLEGKEMEFKSLIPMQYHTSDERSRITHAFTAEEDGVLFFIFSNEHEWLGYGYKTLTYSIEVSTPSFSLPDSERCSIACTMIGQLVDEYDTVYTALDTAVANVYAYQDEVSKIEQEIAELKECLDARKESHAQQISAEEAAISTLRRNYDILPGICIRTLPRAILSQVLSYVPVEIASVSRYWHDVVDNGDMYSDLTAMFSALTLPVRKFDAAHLSTYNSGVHEEEGTSKLHADDAFSSSGKIAAAGRTTGNSTHGHGFPIAINSATAGRLRPREPRYDRSKVSTQNSSLVRGEVESVIYTSPVKTRPAQVAPLSHHQQHSPSKHHRDSHMKLLQIDRRPASATSAADATFTAGAAESYSGAAADSATDVDQQSASLLQGNSSVSAVYLKMFRSAPAPAPEPEPVPAPASVPAPVPVPAPAAVSTPKPVSGLDYSADDYAAAYGFADSSSSPRHSRLAPVEVPAAPCGPNGAKCATDATGAFRVDVSKVGVGKGKTVPMLARWQIAQANEDGDGDGDGDSDSDSDSDGDGDGDGGRGQGGVDTGKRMSRISSGSGSESYSYSDSNSDGEAHGEALSVDKSHEEVEEEEVLYGNHKEGEEDVENEEGEREDGEKKMVEKDEEEDEEGEGEEEMEEGEEGRVRRSAAYEADGKSPPGGRARAASGDKETMETVSMTLSLSTSNSCDLQLSTAQVVAGNANGIAESSDSGLDNEKEDDEESVFDVLTSNSDSPLRNLASFTVSGTEYAGNLRASTAADTKLGKDFKSKKGRTKGEVVEHLEQAFVLDEELEAQKLRIQEQMQRWCVLYTEEHGHPPNSTERQQGAGKNFYLAFREVERNEERNLEEINALLVSMGMTLNQYLAWKLGEK